MKPIEIWKPCPSCQKNNSIFIKHQHIVCENPECHFHVSYACPICHHDLEESDFREEERGLCFQCKGCRNLIPVQKIQYLIQSGMQVDYVNRCGFCNGPTINRQDMNVHPRCFFYPRCSGQADLFGSTRDSFVFIDFETTGLEIGRDALTEVGCVKLDEDGFEYTFQSFIKPTAPIDEKITALTGITNEMVSHAPTLGEVLPRLVEFIGTSKLVAHNADFDVPWLFTSLVRHQLKLPENTLICTLKWARQNGESHSSLGALSKKYKVGHHNAHRALADAMVTKELFLLFESMKKTPYPTLPFEEYWKMGQRISEKYSAFVQA